MVVASLCDQRLRLVDHQLTLGGIAGWGSLGEGWSNRPSGDGQLIVGPSIRYAVYGIGGIEVLGLVPVLGEVGDHRPIGIMINAVRLGSLMLVALDR